FNILICTNVMNEYSNMRYTSSILTCLILIMITQTHLYCQDHFSYDNFVDERDGKVYQTIDLGETIWIAENMKFKTQRSEEHFIEHSETAYDGYYYPLEEVTQVCPDGFRIPNITEWEEYIRLIYKERKNTVDDLEISRLKKKGNELVIAETSNTFDSLNILNIRDHGHTQNGEIFALGSFNMWITHDSSEDPKYHLHLDDEGFSIHTHEHHIIDKEKRRRKFSIRCVKEK
ncbi:MAG: FISUMP domain-containing protein, partial [Bacteroidota bacterium]